MFIGADGSTLRTPEECYVRPSTLVRRLIRHIAPLWGAAVVRRKSL